jgi:lipopolysaccharide export system protein LptA
MTRHPKQRLGQRNLPSATLGATVLALGVLLGGAVYAQAPVSTETAPAPPTPAAAKASTGTPAAGSSFGALSKNSGQPIDIESDVLVVHDAKKYATFKGNVKAVQGTTTLRAIELDVHYVGGGGDSLTGGQAAPAADADAKAGDAKAGTGGALGGDGTQISQIEARGDVIITSDQDQTTTSDWALYDVPAQQVTVGGNVVLMQGKNVLKGDRLVIDLQTGESRFENPGTAAAPGRVRALFMPKDKDAKSGDDKKADDKKTDDKKTEDQKPSDKTADDKPAPSGSESSENAKAPDKAATGAEPHPDSEAWQLLPGQQQ